MTVEFITEERGDSVIEIAYIVNEDGSTESMPKSVWEEREAQKELGGTL